MNDAPRSPDELSSRDLQARFDAVSPGTVGIEEELMLLHPDTLELRPCAQAVIDRLAPDARFKPELPASQIEIVLPPVFDLDEIGPGLLSARRALAAAAEGLARPAGAGAHPFSPGAGRLSGEPRYAEIIAEYGAIAARQLVFALQVHVAVGGARRTLAVYNALRSYLPLLAALAANAPFYEGRDCGLASVRPKLAELLPRQGVPPVIESWEQYAEILRWGARSGAFAAPRAWWWELRPHPGFGTLELRVPDTQTTVAAACAVAAVAHGLVQWLAARHDGGERLPVAATWKIEQNRWSACRYGVTGTMADLETGGPAPTAELLEALLESMGPSPQLEPARRLLHSEGGAAAQRAVAAGPEDGRARVVAAWLAGRFLDTETG